MGGGWGDQARRVCVVGPGAREAALAHRLSDTASVTRWRESTAQHPTPESVEADLFVIGPETHLADGLADRLRASGQLVFGPGADGAMLETSKAYMKEVVTLAGVPTAGFRIFDEVAEAQDFLATLSPPYVVKTDGLAGGKGVLVTHSLDEAKADVAAKLSGTSFGEAGRLVVIEEGLVGDELSLFAICDGTRAHVIPTAARDYKRLRDGDAGPNTGGMGTYSPVDEFNAQHLAALSALTIEPTVAELRRRGIDYRGFLYAGLMLTDDGPKLLEFNVRFGDPEAQVVVPRLQGDLAATLAAAAAGELTQPVTVADDAMVCVTLAAPGYPAALRVGQAVAGVRAEAGSETLRVDVDGAVVFPAGVSVDGTVRVTAGRALSVCGRAPTVADARRIAYDAVAQISFDGMAYRTDIAAPAERTAAQTAGELAAPATLAR